MYKGWAYLVESNGQPGPDYWTYFAGRLVSLAAPAPGAAVLDIGTDDGNVLLKSLARTGNGTGIGIDIDPGGFQQGIRQARKRGWQNRVAFVQMDANALGLAAERFDCVLANFVGWDETFDFERLEFMQPEKITPEIWRTLKPGGQVGLGAWVEQNDIDWINQRFEAFFPEIEKEGKKWSTCYSKENPTGYRLILERSGFNELHEVVDSVSFVSADQESWWTQMKKAVRENFELVSDPIALKRFKDQVFVDLQPFVSPEGIRFSKTVCFVFGKKPDTSK